MKIFETFVKNYTQFPHMINDNNFWIKLDYDTLSLWLTMAHNKRFFFAESNVCTIEWNITNRKRKKILLLWFVCIRVLNSLWLAIKTIFFHFKSPAIFMTLNICLTWNETAPNCRNEYFWKSQWGVFFPPYFHQT